MPLIVDILHGFKQETSADFAAQSGGNDRVLLKYELLPRDFSLYVLEFKPEKLENANKWEEIVFSKAVRMIKKQNKKNDDDDDAEMMFFRFWVKNSLD